MMLPLLMLATFLLAEKNSGLTRDCFREIRDKIKVGYDLGRSMDLVAQKIKLIDFNYVTIVIKINAKMGSNLAEILRKAAENIREKNTTKKEMKSLSAEAFMQIYTLAALPFISAGFLFFIAPQKMMLLFTTTIGLIGFFACIALDIFGIFISTRIARIDI